MAIGGSGQEEGWGETQHLNPYPRRSQSQGPFPPFSDVPGPAKAGTGV